ncbi:hypothetical protein CRENBAI_014707 [Crenichthys baileyi]|uniref:Uncharacterized protein n=1 Tax=Crenichthys baileyi TaxID=28760 RepID=A0AAV9RK81_9TELE
MQQRETFATEQFYWSNLRVQCLVQGHFSSSCYNCVTDMFCLFDPPLLICPGIVTCDHLVINSEPLGNSCPHDARLVLFGSMLQPTLNLLRLTDAVGISFSLSLC